MLTVYVLKNRVGRYNIFSFSFLKRRIAICIFLMQTLIKWSKQMPIFVNPTTIRSLLSTICLAEKYKDTLYNVCCDLTRDRTHEYLSRNLIDNSFEFNWKKIQWYNITICTNLSINTIGFLVNTCAYLTN
jgi:hypothetical protein